MEWLQLIATVFSALAAVLAWAAKLWWSKEFATAKDETIKAKEAQIQTLEREIKSLQELTPMKIREYFLSVKTQLEEYNEGLKQQLNSAREEIATKDGRITELSKTGEQYENEVNNLISEKTGLERRIAYLEEQETILKPVQDEFVTVSGSYNNFSEAYPDLLESINENTKRIKEAMDSIALATPDFSKQFRINIDSMTRGIPKFVIKNKK